MAALDREHEIARDRDVGGHHMHIDAEPARQHAARVKHPGCVVDHAVLSEQDDQELGRKGPGSDPALIDAFAAAERGQPSAP